MGNDIRDFNGTNEEPYVTLIKKDSEYENRYCSYVTTRAWL